MKNWLIEYNTIIPHHSLHMENHEKYHMLWTNVINLCYYYMNKYERYDYDT